MASSELINSSRQLLFGWHFRNPQVNSRTVGMTTITQTVQKLWSGPQPVRSITQDLVVDGWRFTSQRSLLTIYMFRFSNSNAFYNFLNRNPFHSLRVRVSVWHRYMHFFNVKWYLRTTVTTSGASLSTSVDYNLN